MRSKTIFSRIPLISSYVSKKRSEDKHISYWLEKLHIQGEQTRADRKTREKQSHNVTSVLSATKGNDDLERQNILCTGNKITGIVDLDSIHSGDILYEFGHFLFNNVFCDPEVDTETTILYLSKLISSGIINPGDIPLLYGYIYQFAISDIIDFQDLLETTQQEIIDIELLISQYEEALSFASHFFNTGQLKNNSQST